MTVLIAVDSMVHYCPRCSMAKEGGVQAIGEMCADEKRIIPLTRLSSL